MCHTGVVFDIRTGESHNVDIPMRRRNIMLRGYARTSSADQRAGLEAQLAELAKTGVERVFSEQVSAVGPRRTLEEAVDFCRDGETFIVTKLDRLARSVMHLAQI